MSFLRHGEIYRSDEGFSGEKGRGRGTASRWSAPEPSQKTRRKERVWLIVRDEFPAGYSLAGCSPAEPASASPTALRMPEGMAAGKQLPANGNLSLVSVSQPRGALQCTVSSFETRPKGTLRFSLHFAWQRGCLVSEWSWQEKRKRALLESNPPGISCRRLIPMSAGEVALVAASPVFWALGVIGAGLSTSSKPHRDRSPDAFENSTPRAARPVRVLPRSRFAVVRTPPASNSPRPHAVGPGCNSAR